MPRSKEQNERIREAQRIKILVGARKVFARKGWSATMTDIAEETKVSQGLAYRYFKSKESIYLELVQRALQLEPFQNNVEMSGTPMQRLNSLLSKVLDIGNSKRIELYQISAQILADESVPEELRATVRARAQGFRSILKQLIVEGQAAGEVVDEDPEQLVIALLACIDGLSNMGIRGGQQINEHFPDAQIILRMLKP